MTEIGYDIGIEAQEGDHEGPPSLVTIAWENTDDVKNLASFFTVVKGAIAVSEAQCITHKVSMIERRRRIKSLSLGFRQFDPLHLNSYIGVESFLKSQLFFDSPHVITHWGEIFSDVSCVISRVFFLLKTRLKGCLLLAHRLRDSCYPKPLVTPRQLLP